jgi:2-polyprenyl-6-methoxyphenol hydroxylase-like FAD-dependent oxidoreductase
MRKIAIVGAGQAGLQLGFGLLARGAAVTLVAERSADEVFAGRLTVTAGLFATAIAHEQELGLDLWADAAPLIDGVHIDFCIAPRNLLLTVEGRFDGPCRAIDHRLKMSTWMRELARRGGKIIVRAAGISDLEELAATHDAVFVATGKGALSAIFERDEARSFFRRPERNLVAMTLSGLKPWPGISYHHPAKFSITNGQGEIFWIPFLGRRGETCHSVVFEGVPGSPLDRFTAVRTAEEALTTARAVVAEVAPWESATLAEARLIDDLAWGTGALSCVVRRPVAHLPSGRVVFGLGDTVTVYDPVSAQGANSAAKMAHGLAHAVAERGSEPLDAAWMEGWFETYWERHARAMTEFNRIMLLPLQPPAIEVVLAASRSRAVGDRFISAFNDPAGYFPWLDDLGEARRFIARETGHPWLWTGASARLAVGLPQVAQKLGLRSVPETPPVYRGA